MLMAHSVQEIRLVVTTKSTGNKQIFVNVVGILLHSSIFLVVGCENVLCCTPKMLSKIPLIILDADKQHFADVISAYLEGANQTACKPCDMHHSAVKSVPY